MGYLFNARPLLPSSIIWYWLHLKLGSKLVYLCEAPAPSPQILQLGWHQAEGLVGDQRPVTLFLEYAKKLYIYLLTLLLLPLRPHIRPEPGPPPAAPTASSHCCTSAAAASGSNHKSHGVNVVLTFGHEKRCCVLWG